MTTLAIEISPDLYVRLQAEAQRVGRPLEHMIEEWLVERITPKPERDQARAILRAAGLLVEPPEPAPTELPPMSLQDVQQALDRVGGKPLSELILEMRGPKA